MPGKPYPGSFACLRHIAERSKNVGTRGGAVAAIAGLANRHESLKYLEGIARADGKPMVLKMTAFESLVALGDEGRQSIARIEAQETIKDPELRAYFRSLTNLHKNIR